MESASHWNFPVEMKPLHFSEDVNLFDVPQSMARAVVRTDTNQILHVAGSKYKIVEHDTVINAMLDSIKMADLPSDYDWNIKTIDNGAKLKVTFDFKDLTIEPAVGDYINYRISLFNSYDGSWAFMFSACGLRLWCLNGCTTPDTVASSRQKHTASINVKQEATKLTRSLQQFHQSKDLWQYYMKRPVHFSDVEQMFKRTLCKQANPTSQLKHNQVQLETLMRGYNKESIALGNNMWAVYNTATWWASHPQETNRTRAAIPVISRNRDVAVANMMRTREWNELVA